MRRLPPPPLYGRPDTGWRQRLHTVIFESDTRAGLRFDRILIIAILASVGVVIADSMGELHSQYGPQLNALEWLFTFLFSAEYLARLLCVRHRHRHQRTHRTTPAARRSRHLRLPRMPVRRPIADRALLLPLRRSAA